MTGKDFNNLFPYPLRGLGILAIFICTSPAIQALVFLFFEYPWVGGSDLLIEITNVLSKQAMPAILQGYSRYMPTAFISGVLCAIITARGIGLTLNSAILRSIIAIIFMELILIVIISFYIPQPVEKIIKILLAAIVAGILAGWACWIISTRFHLDKSAEENHG